MTVGEIGLIQKLKSTVMKPTNTIIALVISSFSITATAQDKQAIDTPVQKAIAPPEKKQKINFFVVSKRKKGKLDPATSFNVLRTKIKSLWRPKNFVAIIAGDAEQASAKIVHRLKKYNANIGTVWFDSHGCTKRIFSFISAMTFQF
jgi:hypothetical protein